MKNYTLNSYLIEEQPKAKGEVSRLEGFLGFHGRVAKIEMGYIGFIERFRSDERFGRFLDTVYNNPLVVGGVVNGKKTVRYTTAIIFTEGGYYVQVESYELNSGKADYFTGVFKDYLDALRFASGVVRGTGSLVSGLESSAPSVKFRPRYLSL